MGGDGGPAAVLLGLDGFPILAVAEVAGEVELLVETAASLVGCPQCGVVAVLPVTLDQWAVPALRKFMRSYAAKVHRGLVVPNRVRPRMLDGAWAEVVAGRGEPLFMWMYTALAKPKLYREKPLRIAVATSA